MSLQNPPAADEHTAAIAAIAAKDRRLGGIISAVGPFKLIVTRNAFIALAGSIVHQQVSMASAKKTISRVRALCPGRRLTPAAILAATDDELCGAGLSRQKRAYLRNLAEHFADRRLSTASLKRLDDEAVIAAATDVKGIGRWTAEMLLIFCLERPDVWPIDDLGLQKAVARLLGRKERPPSDELTEIGDAWRPYRTYATWYLWRSLEGTHNPGIA